MSQHLVHRLFLAEIEDSIEDLADRLADLERRGPVNYCQEEVGRANCALLRHEIHILSEFRDDIQALPPTHMGNEEALDVLRKLIEREPEEYGDEGAVSRLLKRKLLKVRRFVQL